MSLHLLNFILFLLKLFLNRLWGLLGGLLNFLGNLSFDLWFCAWFYILLSLIILYRSLYVFKEILAAIITLDLFC